MRTLLGIPVALLAVALSSGTAGRLQTGQQRQESGVEWDSQEGLFCIMDWCGNLCQQGGQGLQIKAGLGFAGPALI